MDFLWLLFAVINDHKLHSSNMFAFGFWKPIGSYKTGILKTKMTTSIGVIFTTCDQYRYHNTGKAL